MKQPNTLAKTNIAKSKTEWLVLFIATTAALVIVGQLHWAVALLVAPVVMAAGVLALMAFVQVLWMTVLGAEKLGSMIGLSKSPLL